MGEISGNTWGVDDIVEGQLIDEWAGLEEEGQRLNESALAIVLLIVDKHSHTCPIPPEAPATTATPSVRYSPSARVKSLPHTGFDHICDLSGLLSLDGGVDKSAAANCPSTYYLL